jgi:Domain of unknown function (DUF5615)
VNRDRKAGPDAQHLAHAGKAGWKDWNVVRYARDGDLVLVTNLTAQSTRIILPFRNDA